MRVFAVSLALAGFAATKQVGYFDSDVCADPKGMESCYDDADAAWADCVDTNCQDQNIDCNNVCSCIRTENYVNCAVTHCWNEAYSCEYQQTAGDIFTWCIKPDYSGLPFFPPPDDAPAACSCNWAKLLISIHTTVAETDSCGRKGEDVLDTLATNDDIQAFTASCICCSQTGQLSA